MHSGRIPFVGLVVVVVLLIGLSACEPNSEDIVPSGLSTVTVVVRDGLAYPIYQFRCADVEPDQEPSESCPQGAGCDGMHYHGSGFSIGRVAPTGASDLDYRLGEREDPAQCFCGWGKVGEVDIRDISIFVSDVDEFFDDLLLTTPNPPMLPTGMVRSQAMSVDPCGGS